MKSVCHLLPQLNAEFVSPGWLKAILCRRLALIVIAVSTVALRPKSGGLGLQVRNEETQLQWKQSSSWKKIMGREH
jgi:hypothetical protein